MLLVIILFVLGIVLFNFVMGIIGNIATTNSTQPFSLLIENVSINDTCMTTYVGNRLNHEVSVLTAYINGKPREVYGPLGNDVTIPCNSSGILYVKGPFVVGGLYDIKLIFNNGNSVISVARY